MKSLQAFILHLITTGSVHFVTLISTPCFCLLHRNYYTDLITAKFWGLTGVTGQTPLIVWLFTPTHPPSQSVSCIWGCWPPSKHETDEILTSLRQMALTLPAAIVARAMNPISLSPFLCSSVGARENCLIITIMVHIQFHLERTKWQSYLDFFLFTPTQLLCWGFIVLLDYNKPLQAHKYSNNACCAQRKFTYNTGIKRNTIKK